MRSVAPALLAALAIALAGCGGDDEADPTGPGGTGAATTAPETGTGTDTAGDTTGEDDGPPFGTEPVTGEAAATGTALLTDVRLGRHEGFDRVVFEFREGTPGYRVEYVEPPIREDGSGNPVELEGEAFLQVRMEPASGFDLDVPEGEQTYTGPTRFDGADAGTDAVAELVRTGDFEAVLTWVAGVDEPRPFRVQTLDGPPRLVVDVRND